MNLQKVRIKFTNDFETEYDKAFKGLFDLDEYTASDFLDMFNKKVNKNGSDYKVKEIYYMSPNGTKLTIYPFDIEDNKDMYDYGLGVGGVHGEETDDEIYADYGRKADAMIDEDKYGMYDSLDSISVERCDDCNMEISKSKITNDKFRDSIKCKVTDSKSSVSFDGKIEDVIDAVELATGMSKEDIINQLISKL